jgi:hypothetical protein
MRVIARILCGSHLYGCDVPESDRDYKIVYIPSADNILLQCADKLDPEEMPAIVKQLKKDAGIRKDPDVEFMSYRQFLKLLCQGQTNAMDMFFAPDENFVGKKEPEWYSLQVHKDRWVSKNAASFVGYCRQQASKYVVKLDRFEAVKNMMDFLITNCIDGSQRLEELYEGLDNLVLSDEHTEWIRKETAHGTEIAHISVCQTMIPVTATVKLALETFGRKLEGYGERVKSVSNMDSSDWKSMYHAVRVAEEALELLQTGKLTFPRPERNLLTAIRLGKIPFEKVSAVIEENLKKVEKAVEKSKLREQPDWEYADELVKTFYRNSVISER